MYISLSDLAFCGHCLFFIVVVLFLNVGYVCCAHWLVLVPHCLVCTMKIKYNNTKIVFMKTITIIHLFKQFIIK